MARTMIERVAEAMWQAEWARAGNGGKRRVPWSEIAPIDQDRYRFVARASVEAMRVPNNVMKDAGCYVGPDTNSGQFGYDDAEVVYIAMIDAALTQA